MISCEVKIRVRYGETDRMGYLHHGVYPLYFEEGRTELLRLYGMNYKDMEDSGFLLPVSKMDIEYYTPAVYDDLLTVKTSIIEKPGIKIRFIYETFNSEGSLINKAFTDLVFVKSSTRKPCKPPQNFINLINQYF